MKTEVYSWRVSADLKSGLEHEAHRRSISLASLLDLAARDWLKKEGAGLGDDAEQVRLHRAASECLGAFAGGDPKRNIERVRPMIATENEADWWYENRNVHGQQLRGTVRTRQAQALTPAKLRERLAASKKTPSPVVACDAPKLA